MAELLKDRYLTLSSLSHFARKVKEVKPGFESDGFLTLVFDDTWEQLELKGRMRKVTLALHRSLGLPYPDVIQILMSIAPEIKGFDAMVLPDYVEVYGLDHWDLSFQAMERFTQYSSSEFAVRPFIIKDPQRAMEHFHKWSKSNNHHVRRLSSEGCRPMLPWAMALPVFKNDPRPILPILDELKNDSSLYVRKSVANNLNDISKNQPELVLELCEKWNGTSENTNWIIKHACRTMLKSGNSAAMLFFGFASPDLLEINKLHVAPTEIHVGEEVQFQFVLKNRSDKKLKVRIEYIIHFITKNGKSSPKVFQLKETMIKPGDTEVKKKHSFTEKTTRKHYPGTHRIEIKLNGIVKSECSFMLK